MSASRTKFYLDKQNAKWLGVCSGIADYTGIDVTWVRVGTVLGSILGSGFLIIAYLVIGWIAEAKPYGLYTDKEESDFWQGVRQSPARTTRDVRSKLRDIDRRMANAETHYTSRNSRLADEIDNLK
jgi:phage shock protein C